MEEWGWVKTNKLYLHNSNPIKEELDQRKELEKNHNTESKTTKIF